MEEKKDPTISIPTHIIRCPWLGSNAKIVWISIFSHADFKTRECNLSLEAIVNDSNLNRRTVQRAIKELRGSGFLITPWKPRGRGQKSTLYRCIIPPKEVCQKRPSFHSLYVKPFTGVSSNGEWYERREGNKVFILPVSSIGIHENPYHNPNGDCDCQKCMKEDFTGFPSEERIAAAGEGIEITPPLPSES